MLRADPEAAPDTYGYGPVRVAGEARGRGLAGAMLAARRAHAWMGMCEVAGSALGGAGMAALAYVG